MKTDNTNENTPSRHTGEQQKSTSKLESMYNDSFHDTDISKIYPDVTNLFEELDALKPHDHLCLIYESKEEWREAVIPFLTIGLGKAEKCFYVVEHSTADEIRTYLKEEGIDVAAIEESGQLVILHETDAYTREGSFDPDRMIALLISETEKAVAEGYPALRVTGEMTWVLHGYPGSEKLLEYEAKLNRDLFPYYPCLAICQYDRWKFDPEIIKGIIMTHPKLIRHNSVYRNFYYIPPEAFLNQKSAEVECQHWLTNVEREHKIWKELVESREKFIVLVENMGNALAVYKPVDDGQDFIFVYFNRAAERIDQINREEVIGESVFNIFPGIKEFGLLDVFQRVLCTGKPEFYPGSFYQDGRVSGWRENYVYKLHSGEIAAIYEDITEHKLAEEKVKSSELRYRRLFETAQDAILILDGETGQIIDANPFIIDMLGGSLEELQGKSLWEIGASRDALASKRLYQQLNRTGYVRYEHLPLIAKDGLQIDVEVVANAYTVAEKRVFQCNIRDVTDRNRIETSLRDSEARYRTLFESAAEGIVISDVETRAFQYVNPAFCTMLGYSYEELMTMRITDIYPETLFKQVHDEYESQVRGDKSLASSIPCLKKDGTIIFVDINTGTTDIDGMKCNIVFFTDISERRLIEEERERSAKLESVGTLAGGIAHDFNNILTGILGNIGLAAININSGNVNDAIARLKDAETASFQARNLTQQLLTFSKGGAPVKNLINFGQLIQEATAFALTGSNIKPEFSIPADLWTIKADKGQLNQVISNLLINACQSMPNGGTLGIRAENIVIKAERNLPLPEGDYIKIDIEDHGIGIPEEYQRKIFTPYFTTKQKGSGLGLATTYSVVKNHDGYITFQSKLGIGTTFSIYIPASGELLLVEPEEENVLPIPTDHPRILVMDDEDIILMLLKRALTNIGYEVDISRDGAEAIALYTDANKSGKPYDAVILDLTVPGGMGGKDVIKKLLEFDPEVKAIVSSGYSTDPIMAEYKKFGFSGVVTKPYNLVQMESTLHDILTGKQAI